jgi:carboxymethylenebutenolidase
MAHITAPVFGFYAGNDARISLTVPDTRKQMKSAGKEYQAVVYDGAGHGFMRAGEQPDPTPANAGARAAAWAKMMQVMKH